MEITKTEYACFTIILLTIIFTIFILGGMYGVNKVRKALVGKEVSCVSVIQNRKKQEIETLGYLSVEDAQKLLDTKMLLP